MCVGGGHSYVVGVCMLGEGGALVWWRCLCKVASSGGRVVSVS